MAVADPPGRSQDLPDIGSLMVDAARALWTGLVAGRCSQQVANDPAGPRSSPGVRNPPSDRGGASR